MWEGWREGGRKGKKLESRTAENYILKRVKIFTNQFRKLHGSTSIQQFTDFFRFNTLDVCRCFFIYDKCVDYAPELRLRDISTFGLVFNMKSICVGRWMITRRATPAENTHLRVKVRNTNTS